MPNNQAEYTAWAQGFLNFLNAPATGPSDPRVQFLAAWAAHENTGDMTNPLAIEDGGATLNSAGVSKFANVNAGYQALHSYLVNRGITGVLSALTNTQSTIPELTAQLEGAHWEGSANAKALQSSQNYAQTIGQAASQGTLNSSSSASVSGAQVGGALLNSNKVSGSTTPTQSAPITQSFLGDMNKQYTGPGSYKGFDISKIPASLRQQTERAIDTFTSDPALQRQTMQSVYQTYGNMAWAASDPEIRTILIAGTLNNWQADKALVQSLYADTTLYKTSSASQLAWRQISADQPGEAQHAIAQASAAITDIASKLGVQLTPAQVQQMAQQVAPNSVSVAGQFSNTVESQQQIYQMVTAQFNANQFSQGIQQTAQGGTPGDTAPNTQGMAAELYNQFQTISRNYYLGMTPQRISQYVQQYLQGDTGAGFDPATAVAGFTSLAQTQARQMYPTLASSIGTQNSVGADNTPYQSTAWIRDMIAQYSGLGSGDNVDLTSPQWKWILGGSGPPTPNSSNDIFSGAGSSTPTTGSGANATPSIPSSDQLQTYLMQTPQFQSTHLAKQMAWNVGSQIVKAFGY